MSQFTAELSQLAGIEGSTEDIARDIAPTTPAHPPRAARRETLDVSLDHNIDIDAAREELARRRRAQALASMTDAELQRLLLTPVRILNRWRRRHHLQMPLRFLQLAATTLPSQWPTRLLFLLSARACLMPRCTPRLLEIR